MHINDVPFLTKMSNNMHYGTIAALANLKCPNLEFELKNVICSCAVRGFRITMAIVDMKFKALKDRNLLGVSVNAVSKDKHVTKV